MKLYKVRIEYETVIRAESEEAAAADAETNLGSEIDDEPQLVRATEIKTLDDLPAGWNPYCRPWGERDPEDRTIGKILS